MATSNGSPRCRHCKVKFAGRPRGLCFTCYYLPGVREQYPPLSRMGEAGACREDHYRAPRKMPKPTNALPGTSEKIEVLRARFERREWLWHPLDSRDED